MGIVWFFLGLITGGCLGVLLMCCFQLRRVNSYEAEIRRLKEQQNTKK